MYSGFVENHLAAPVTVRATYHKTTGEDEIVEKTVAAGGRVEFEQRTWADGSCNFTYVITRVAIATGAANAEAAAPFQGVSSPTKGFVWAVQGSAEAPSIAQHM